jgi:hypothetical protein
MATGNAINANSTGIQAYDGAGTFYGRTLQPGTGITISNGSGAAGDPTINATGGGIAWAETAISVAATNNKGWQTTAMGITITLPANAAGLIEGTIVAVQATTADVVIIQANTSQFIHLGVVASSSAGTATSIKIGDTITLVYQLSTTSWWAQSSVGNWVIA